jgi:hypothetical protein
MGRNGVRSTGASWRDPEFGDQMIDAGRDRETVAAAGARSVVTTPYFRLQQSAVSP